MGSFTVAHLPDHLQRPSSGALCSLICIIALHCPSTMPSGHHPVSCLHMLRMNTDNVDSRPGKKNENEPLWLIASCAGPVKVMKDHGRLHFWATAQSIAFATGIGSHNADNLANSRMTK